MTSLIDGDKIGSFTNNPLIQPSMVSNLNLTDEKICPLFQEKINQLPDVIKRSVHQVNALEKYYNCKNAPTISTAICGSLLGVIALAAAIFNPYTLAAITSILPTLGTWLSGLGIWGLAMSNPVGIAISAIITALLLIGLIIGLIYMSFTSRFAKEKQIVLKEPIQGPAGMIYSMPIADSTDEQILEDINARKQKINWLNEVNTDAPKFLEFLKKLIKDTSYKINKDFPEDKYKNAEDIFKSFSSILQYLNRLPQKESSKLIQELYNLVQCDPIWASYQEVFLSTLDSNQNRCLAIIMLCREGFSGMLTKLNNESAPESEL